MRKLIQQAFGILGLEIKRKPLAKKFCHYNEQMSAGFKRFSELSLPVNTVVDVGAAQGLWALSASAYWPDASYVLFEPLQERAVELQGLIKTHERFLYIPKAAGKESGTVYFSVADDLDGSGVASDLANPKARSVEVSSIQEELARYNLKGPYIIKLDTHGFEVPILQGCNEILTDVSLFIIECYGFEIVPGSLLFWEMCSHMNSLGFRLFDIVDIMHRGKDGAFWQCDAFFIRKDNPIFLDNKYV